jgi:hypothetical protein
MTDLAAQLRDELSQRAWNWAALLGLDWHDITVERIAGRVGMLAHQLRSAENEDRLAAETAQDVMMALWPEEDPPPEWWSTPLGRAIAASYGLPGAEAVSASVAAAMLGVSRGRIYQLLGGGKLERHPDGGVTATSVAQRLGSTEGN